MLVNLYNYWNFVIAASVIIGIFPNIVSILTSNDNSKNDDSKKKITRKNVSTLLLVGFIILAFSAWSVHEEYVYVPRVIGLSMDNAVQTLVSYDLGWELPDGQDYSLSKKILSQDPAKGILVKKGLIVKISYDTSLSPEPLSSTACNHMIDSSEVEDYSKNLKPEKYTEYTSDYKDFCFSHPSHLFNRVECSRDAYDTLLGKNIETHAFYGSLGTMLTFSLSSITDPLTDRLEWNKVYGSLYSQESAEITKDKKDIKNKETGFDGFIVTGFDKNGMVIYKIVRIYSNYVMEMRISSPPFVNTADRLHKRYVHECLEKLCGFSGEKRGSARSYSDFLNAQ